MIFISGQVNLKQTINNSRLRQVGVQEIDIVNLVKSNTKYAVKISNPKDIKYHLEKAYQISIEGRPGPVWIDIPADIQNAQISEKNLLLIKKSIKKVFKENKR